MVRMDVKWFRATGPTITKGLAQEKRLTWGYHPSREGRMRTDLSDIGRRQPPRLRHEREDKDQSRERRGG